MAKHQLMPRWIRRQIWRVKWHFRVVPFGRYRIRVTLRWFRIHGIELWIEDTENHSYGYMVWRADNRG